jgi:CRISPR/Cas system CSM-associated protein Csm3 (group 7 of RAMP superfamily)
MTTTPIPPAAQEARQHRRVRSVTFIRYFLRFTEPGAVTVPGFPDRNEDAPWGPQRAHLLVDTDPWGRPHLPGTSLAGALREMVTCAADSATADELFGHVLPAGTGNIDEVDARASLLWVLGTRPVGPDGTELRTVPTQVRASTAISRSRGAAERNTLRVEEVLPPGSRFETFLRWDDAPTAGLEMLLAMLADWQPLMGRGTSRGRGRCVIDKICYGTLDLGEPAGLYRWLSTSGPELARTVSSTEIDLTGKSFQPRALLRLSMAISGPLRVGSGEPPEAIGDEGQQVTPMFRDGNRYVLPGTGLKGLLRSRVEYILRSVGISPSPCLNQQCGTCWTCKVFGHAGGQDSSAEAVGERAQVRIPDAVIEKPVLVQRKHVAIDRFTGGAHPGLLYTVDALESGNFTFAVEPLVDDEPPDRMTEIRALLRLVFQDLNDGLIGIGAGVARGYGSVNADLASAESRGDLPDVRTAQAELQAMVAASKEVEAP